MWTPATRRQHSRDHLRYGSDLSDAEWEIIAPFMPAPAKTGRPRVADAGDHQPQCPALGLRLAHLLQFARPRVR